MKKNKEIYTIVASFFVMFVFAITESIRGILIPTFKIDFNVTDTKIGIFLFVSTLAYVVGTYFAGKIILKYGQKNTMMIGIVIAGLGFLGTSFSQTYLHLVIGYIILTTGTSLILMSLNTIIPLLKVAYLAIIMNWLHFFYGLGATITQRVAGYLISIDVSWRHIFIVFSIFYVILFIIYSFVEQPKVKMKEIHKYKIKSYEKKLVLFFSLSLGFYITAEMQTANWLLNYLKEVYIYDANKASFYVAFFFGALAIGRLLGGYILEKTGYLTGLKLTLFFAFVLYVIGLFNERTLILLSLSGFFFSIVYPTTILVLHKYFHENATKVVSVVTMIASAVSMITGYLIGFLNDNIGVVKSFLLIPISILLSLLLFIVISVEVKRVEKIRLIE